MTTTSLGVVVSVTLVETSGLLTGSGETTSLTVLVDWLSDPVVSGITSDGLVLWVNEDDLEVLVGGVLVNPVGVQDSQVSSTTANTLLSGGTQGLLVLQLRNTLVGWLTVSSTLWNRSLSVTSSNSDTVDNETLLGLVTQTSSLVWTGWSGSTVNNVLLTVFPNSDSEQESVDVRLFLSLQFFQVLVGTHCYLSVSMCNEMFEELR